MSWRSRSRLTATAPSRSALTDGRHRPQVSAQKSSDSRSVTGRARIKLADGDVRGARLLLQSQLAKTVTPDLAMVVGELSLGLDDHVGAEQYFQMAEQIERGAWGSGQRLPQFMARLLSDRAGREREALVLAEEAARSRADIFTMDTLAWAYYKNGRSREAHDAMRQALRTGSRDARIRCHAEVIGSGSLRAGGVISGRAPAATRHCLEWRP